MRKSYISLVGLISIMLAGCGNSNDLMSQNETLKAQVESLSYEKESMSSAIESLSIELDSEKEKLKTLQASIEESKAEVEIRQEDVTVSVTDKNTSTGKYGQMYCTTVFEVTNNTEKDIQGVEGDLKINDLFGKEILTLGCDFTGKTIPSGEKVVFDDMTYDVNQFINIDMQYYNTDYKDLKFEYTVSQIVFTDGSVKK